VSGGLRTGSGADSSRDSRSAPGGARLEVYHHLLAAVAEEMGAALQRSAFSPNVKERRDFSCALFDGQGRLVAQAAHVPVHLGSAPLSIEAVLKAVDLQPGDVVLHNDPYSGGTHLPDITAVTPVFLAGRGTPAFLVANRAHHADVGGAFPGSMAPARDVHGEGLRIPPVFLVRGGVVDERLLALLLANVRGPEERRADLLAQWSSNLVGVRRLEALAAEQGVDVLVGAAAALCTWTDSLVGELLATLPRGTFRYTDFLEAPDPADAGGERRQEPERASVRVAITNDGVRLVVDLTDCAPQSPAPVNTTRAVSVSAVLYVLRLLLPDGTPTNDGVLRRVEVRTRPGTIADASYPAPVAAGNVETSQRLVDVLLGALAEVLPERIPAASAGTMSNLTLGGADGSFAYYETNAGGAGGGPLRSGAHAVQTHMTNTRTTPVEALENELPLRVLAWTVRRGSGGAGTHPGGDGVLRRIQVLRDTRVGWIADRSVVGPYGLAGGARGALGRGSLRFPGDALERTLPSRAAVDLPAGGEVSVETPGGGGHGPPMP
jgi:N-methylhydantoinase B